MNESTWAGVFGCGFIIGVAAAAITGAILDSSAEYTEKRLAHVVDLCAKMGQGAESFDYNSVTCKNGTVISFNEEDFLNK